MSGPSTPVSGSSSPAVSPPRSPQAERKSPPPAAASTAGLADALNLGGGVFGAGTPGSPTTRLESGASPDQTGAGQSRDASPGHARSFSDGGSTTPPLRHTSGPATGTGAVDDKELDASLRPFEGDDRAAAPTTPPAGDTNPRMPDWAALQTPKAELAPTGRPPTALRDALGASPERDLLATTTGAAGTGVTGTNDGASAPLLLPPSEARATEGGGFPLLNLDKAQGSAIGAGSSGDAAVDFPHPELRSNPFEAKTPPKGGDPVTPERKARPPVHSIGLGGQRLTPPYVLGPPPSTLTATLQSTASTTLGFAKTVTIGAAGIALSAWISHVNNQCTGDNLGNRTMTWCYPEEAATSVLGSLWS